MSDEIHRRLEILEMALGIETPDKEYCLSQDGPASSCSFCDPDVCPVVNNLLQSTANETYALVGRVRRLELWLDQIDLTTLPRERAILLEQREHLLANIADVEKSIQQSRAVVAHNLTQFLTAQRDKLECLNEQIGYLQDG